VPYRFLGVDLDLGAGAKTGQLELAFPETRRRIPPGERRAVWQSAFGKSLKEARVSLRAVLCRQRISLSALAAMAPGETLGLPRSVLASVALETIEGRRVAEARLGRSDGFRAIRLNASAEVPPGMARAGAEDAGPDPLATRGTDDPGVRDIRETECAPGPGAEA
jgi:flagellar motor switch/type III secretory pathway protein FliN